MRGRSWKPLLADDKGAWAVSLGKPPGSHIQAIKGFMLFPKHSSATIFHIFHDLRTRVRARRVAAQLAKERRLTHTRARRSRR